MNQSIESQVLEHLKSGKTVTSAEAMKLWDCHRLSAVIHSLRKAGHEIETLTEPNAKHKGTHGRYKYINGEG